MGFVTRFLLNILALLVMSEYVPGITVASFYAAAISVVVLGVLHVLARPVLVVLTLPVTIVTLGLFVFVINAGLFLFAASFIEGFTVENFGAALLGSVLLSVAGAIGDRIT